MSKRYCVRVILPDGINNLTPELELMLEQLRAAGLVMVHRIGIERGDNKCSTCFDLLAPISVPGDSTKLWADKNAARMQSFGYNAVAAPSTEEVSREG